MGTTLSSKPGEYIWQRKGKIVRCPWHGWEFDIAMGLSVFNPHRLRVKSYKVMVKAVRPETDPNVETYAVAVEDELVILYI
jgi:nitrite reductase/ring-hydroxylating ferredoxin subunit